MTIKNKLAQLSLLLTLFVGAVAALPPSNDTVFGSSGAGSTLMGECAGSGGSCT